MLRSPAPARHPQPRTLGPLQAPERPSGTHEVDFLLPGAFFTQHKERVMLWIGPLI